MGLSPRARTGGTGALVAFGDGAIVRKVLDAIVSFLSDFAAPTGARGSILLMAGGLVVLGFLFLAFVFRSAIVGDLAPVANARAPIPRVLLPPRPHEVAAEPRRVPVGDFSAGRREGRGVEEGLDGVFELLRAQGSEARIMESGAMRKRVRLYRCASCVAGVRHKGLGCEHERGILAGGFESLTGELAKVRETTCAGAGGEWCEFEIQHAPLRRAAP